MEGSLLILPGSGLVALGMYLGGRDRKTVLFWTWVFILIAVGVGALFGFRAVGGIGGKTGRSMWWGLLMLPYPIGWLMALLGAAILSLSFPKPNTGGHTLERYGDVSCGICEPLADWGVGRKAISNAHAAH